MGVPVGGRFFVSAMRNVGDIDDEFPAFLYEVSVRDEGGKEIACLFFRPDGSVFGDHTGTPAVPAAVWVAAGACVTPTKGAWFDAAGAAVGPQA